MPPSDALVEGDSGNWERDSRYSLGSWVGAEPSGDAAVGEDEVF